MNENIRQRYDHLVTAYGIVEKYLTGPLAKPTDDEFNRAAIVQYFNVLFELSWQLMREYLLEQGMELYTPAEVIYEAHKGGLIPDSSIYMDMLYDRNRSNKIFKQELSLTLCDNIRKEYFYEFNNLRDRFSIELKLDEDLRMPATSISEPESDKASASSEQEQKLEQELAALRAKLEQGHIEINKRLEELKKIQNKNKA